MCSNDSNLRFQTHRMHGLELVLSRRNHPQAIEIRNKLPFHFLVNIERPEPPGSEATNQASHEKAGSRPSGPQTQPDQSTPHFLQSFPLTMALFDHLVDSTSPLQLDETSRRGIRPILLEPNGDPFISIPNWDHHTRALTDIATRYECSGLYEDLQILRNRPVNGPPVRVCMNCDKPGRYKDGQCVEKWGFGSYGTVCERCDDESLDAMLLETAGAGGGSRVRHFLPPQLGPPQPKKIYHSKSIGPPLSSSGSVAGSGPGNATTAAGAGGAAGGGPSAGRR
jgi:hypothetical protein